jgi:hypothetical protein
MHKIMSQETPNRKYVSFRATVKGRECLHRNNYSRRELKATWYSQHEMNKAVEESRKTIRSMIQGKCIGKHMCTRGLECQTLSGAIKREQNKAAGYIAVEDEQLRQWANDAYDPQALADEYISSTRHSAAAARDQGGRDRHEVVEQENPIRDASPREKAITIALAKGSHRTPSCPLLVPRAYGPLSPAA